MNLKNITVMNPSFVSAIEKLLKQELPVKDCFRLSKAVKELNDNLEAIEKAKLGILNRFAEKDDKGEVKLENGTTPLFKSEEDKKVFLEEVRKLSEETFDISLEEKVKIPESILMTVDDVMALEELIEIKE